MNNKIDLIDITNHLDKEIELVGFIDNIRDLQYVQFLILRDKTGKLQVTIEKDEANKELNEIVSNLTLESTLKIKGIAKENEKVKLGGVEFIPINIEVTSKSALELPINFKDLNAANLDTRLDNRFIDLRNEKNALIFNIQSYLIQVMREYLYNNNFMEIHTPKIIGTASESGASVFELKYFDRKAFLAQSPQFYKQMAMASGFERVFEVAPCFRAENSNTSRHATEYTSFDLEFSYIKSYEDVMKFEEDLIVFALSKVAEKYGDKIEEQFDTKIIVPTKPFPVITLQELYKVLKDNYNYEIPGEDNGDLNAEGERLACEYAKSKLGSEFLFVTGYSDLKRPFYHMRNESNEPLGYDLLWRGVEITSGSQREHRYEEIIKQANRFGLTKDVEFYTEFFKYGCPPHGGFAIGVDRLTMLLLNIPTIKESMFLFRGPTRLDP